MTANEALERLQRDGFECVGFVIVRESDNTGGFAWLGNRPEEDLKRRLLQVELDGTYEAGVIRSCPAKVLDFVPPGLKKRD
jgi:hypothetical protein